MFSKLLMKILVKGWFRAARCDKPKKGSCILGCNAVQLGRSFFIIKPTNCTNFTNSFCHEILHVSDSSFVHHQEFIHCTLSNGICHICCRQLSNRTRMELSSILLEGCQQSCIHMSLLSVQWINSWWWPDELSETCRVSCQNKFVKLVHLKGKGIAVPLQAWSGPEGSRKLRFPDFLKKAEDGGKVVSLTHPPPLPQGNTPGTHFC